MLSYKTLERFRVGSISFTPIHIDKQIGGFLFHIRGLDFFLSLYPGHALPTLNTLGIGDDGKVPKHIASATPEYRKNTVSVINEHGERSDIKFNWRKETAVSSDPKYHLPPEETNR
ncbi:hypothetical protein [Imhoffiella purpurea]|uniref:hypothetical protein n=1 Tax=Imhoffiella purpurea TaxID=1249627 RepID=UPI0012FE7C8A|nr:hypothetical protein [Imhoffiella purpurea]